MASSMKTQSETLVLGGTGKTGRRVAERLQARGVPVRIGSRSGDPRFDWEEPATWGPALDGAGSVYISYQPDLGMDGAADAVGSLAEQAVRGGASRVVLLAGRGEPEHLVAEDAVRASGADLTIIRSAWFMQNFSEDFMLDDVLSGQVALPAGETREPFVDAADLADVAVAALTGEGHAGQVYEVTGPRLMTFGEAVGQIARATGREIAYTPVTVAEYTAAAAGQGVPPDFVELLGYLFGELLDGRNAQLGDGVQRALGREPRGFADYAGRAAADGAWKVHAATG